MKEFRLGVLFVHGIGTQPPRDTLVRWGDALVKVIGRATKAEPGRIVPMVGRADAGDRSGAHPAEVAVTFRSDRDQNEKWLLAEGWWADSFPAPTYSELVSWSFRAAPWAISLHIAQRYWQTDPKASKGLLRWPFAIAVAKLLVAMALTPVFMALLALSLVLGLLPIPQLRSLILTAQAKLIGSVGDSLAFVESPLRAALIRGRILDGLERLKDRCDRTVIVAHSQGAAATLDALGGVLDHDETGESSTAPPQAAVPDALVTFGSGVNQLVSLKVLSRGGLERKTGMNAAIVAVMATLGMAALFVLLLVGIRSGNITGEQLVKALVVFLAFVGVCIVVASVARWILGKLAAWRMRRAPKEAADRKFRMWEKLAIGVVFVALVISFIEVHDHMPELPTLQVEILGFALAGLWGSLRIILSADTRTAVTRPVRHPPGLARWMDVYASADPVPNGPTRIEGTWEDVTSVKVWNRGAFLSDHTTYWENLDGFVLRVARICVETAGSPWQHKLPPVAEAGWLDLRAAWRVRRLQWMVWINRVLWLLLLWPLWVRHQACVPLPFSFPPWFGDWGPAVARTTILTALVVLAAWASAALLRWRWSVWVRAEQQAVLAQERPQAMTWPSLPFSGLGFVIALLVVAVIALVFEYESQASELVADEKNWLSVPIAILVLGVWISWILGWLWQGPQPPQPKA